MADIKIFLSAVSSEFGHYRARVRDKLSRGINVTIKIEEDFGPTGEDTLAMLNAYIRDCTAVTHLIGDMTGTSPPQSSVRQLLSMLPDLPQSLNLTAQDLLSSSPSISYTQWEAYLAIHHRKPLFIAEPDLNAERDRRTYSYDVDQARAQQQHRDRLRAIDRWPEMHFNNADDLSFELVLGSLNQKIQRGYRQEAQFTPAGLQRFEEYYLIGQRQHGQLIPPPFGGRKRELRHLNNWLHNSNTDWRLLVSSPAGRGKSALLAKWIESVRRSSDERDTAWNVVFVAISNRFHTNSPETYLGVIAQRLALIARENLPVPASDPATYYRNSISSLISQITASQCYLLIAIDGLDEALGEEFLSNVLPSNPSPHLKVLVSARWIVGDSDGSGWRQRLGWIGPRFADGHDLTLAPLNTTDISDVLVTMGAPIDVVGRNFSLVERLYKLTSGEPLLLRFYAEDLWLRRSANSPVTVDTLDKMEPGFGPYFRQWITFQGGIASDAVGRLDPRTTEAVMGILGFAKGPLSSADLLDIAVTTFPTLPWRLTAKAHIEPFARFVVGDGSPRSPYVLSHPKLGEHIRDVECADLADTVKSGFVLWGRKQVSQLNAQERAPQLASPYALQFIGHHFIESETSIDTLLLLTQEAWRRAWGHLEGGERGFSTTVRLVLQALERAEPPNIGAILRCRLILSSIQSMGHHVPGALLLSALKHRVLSLQQCWHLAELIGDTSDAVVTIVRLAHEASSRQAVALEMVGAAISRAATIKSEWQRGKVLARSAEELFRDYRREENIKAATASAETQSDFLSTAFAIFMRTVSAIGKGRARAVALISLTKLCPENSIDTLGAATLESIGSVDGINEKLYLMLELLEVAPPMRSTQLLHDILAGIPTIQMPWSRIFASLQALRFVAPTRQGEAIRGVISDIESIGLEWPKAQAIAKAAKWLAPNQLTTVLDIADQIKDKGAQAVALAGIAPFLSDSRRSVVFEKAKKGAASIQSLNNRVRLIEGLVGAQAPEQVIALSGEVLGPILTGENEAAICDALAMISPSMSQDQLASTLVYVREMTDVTLRVRALSSLAEQLAPEIAADVVKELMATIRSAGERSQRLELLGHLAPTLRAMEDASVSESDLDHIVSTDGVSSRASDLRHVAPYLAAEQIGVALAAAKEIGDQEFSVRALSRIAHHSPKRDRAEVIWDALKLAAGAETEVGRARSIIVLGRELMPEHADHALSIVAQFKKDDCRASAIVTLAKLLSMEHGRATIDEAMSIKRRELRVKVLHALSLHLTGRMKRELDNTVRAMANEIVKGRINKSGERDDGRRARRRMFSEPDLEPDLEPELELVRHLLSPLDEWKLRDPEDGDIFVRGLQDPLTWVSDRSVPYPISRERATASRRQATRFHAKEFFHRVNEMGRSNLLEALDMSLPGIYEIVGQEGLSQIRRSIVEVNQWYK